MIDTPQITFNENRSIVVLYHEIGHVLHHRKYPLTTNERNAEQERTNDEISAMQYSISECVKLFDKGDPLR